MGRVRTTIEERFWSYVNKSGRLMPGMTSRCWEWQGANDGNYGEFLVLTEPKQVVKYAHAFAWELYGGLSPTRKFPLHHLCGNKLCVNPNHMAMVTRAGHSMLHTVTFDAKCKNGHPFDEVNPLIDGKGYRRCRECANESRQRSKEKRGKKNAKKSAR
jgi:hypothetical protein